MRLINDLHHKVYVATAIREGRKVGFVITWVTPASLTAANPKILLVVSKFNHSAEVLLETRRCVLNVLSKQQTNEFFIFGSTHSDEVDKFQGVAHEVGTFGVRLAAGAGSAEVDVEEVFETPDRYLLYCSVRTEMASGNDPLILGEALASLTPAQKRALEEKMAADSARDEKQFTP